jgi:hypothetical protein
MNRPPLSSARTMLFLICAFLLSSSCIVQPSPLPNPAKPLLTHTQPPSSLTPTSQASRYPDITALSWDEAKTAEARGTALESMTIETDTPSPRSLPTPPPGRQYFRVYSVANGVLYLLYDPTVWQDLLAEDAPFLAIEGEAGLVHRSIPGCEIYNLAGGDSAGEIKTEEWPDGRYGLEARYCFFDGKVEFITFPGIDVELDVQPDHMEPCLDAAREVVLSHVFVIK